LTSILEVTDSNLGRKIDHIHLDISWLVIFPSGLYRYGPSNCTMTASSHTDKSSYLTPYSKVKPSLCRPGQVAFLHSRQMKVVNLSIEINPGTHFCWGRVDLKVIVRPEGLSQWTIPTTRSGIETATIRNVPHCLNQVRFRAPFYAT
jgi:hypothetical protein